jgi:hypothetical protein
MKVTLDRCEALIAAEEGLRRRLRRIYGNAQADRFNPEHRFDTDIEATGAEIAFAKFRGLYWAPSEGPQGHRQGDVGPFEVRHTTHDDGHLVVYGHTHDEKRCVLVTGRMPEYTIRGWIVARVAKQPRYSRSFSIPTYYYPQADLYTFDEAVAA